MNNNTQTVEVHEKVIKIMESLGYGILKDGETFYKKGYELDPQLVPTFSMTQAYTMIALLQRVREEERKEFLQIAEESTKWIGHYQQLLNDYDGGERKGFKILDDFLAKYAPQSKPEQ